MAALKGLKDEGGQSLVEYALVLPILLLLLLGIMEFGILVFNYNTIANAAREGARYGIVHSDDAAGIEKAARRLTVGLDQDPDQDPARLRIIADSEIVPGAFRVTVEYDVWLVTGMLLEVVGVEMPLTLRAAATMQLE